MSFTERLALIITANPEQALREIKKVGSTAERELGKATSTTEKFASSSLKIGAGLVAAGGVALPMLARLGQGASGLNEQISASSVTFRENAADVQAWSGDLAGSFGISQRAALTAANNFGAMFRGLGIGGEQATKMSKRLVELSADLASFKDLQGGATEALERLRSGLAGEAEPLRRMDIFLNEAAVSAKAMELSIAGASDKLTDSQKVQARYALILEQTALAQGDFARTSDSLANSQRIAAAEAENAKNAFGQGVVGPMTAATQAVGGLAAGLGGLSPEIASTVGTIATIGAATSVAVGGLALLSGGVIRAKLNFQNAEGSLNNFGRAAKGLGVVAGVASAVYGLSGAFDALGISAKSRSKDVQDLARMTDRELRAAVEKLRDVTDGLDIVFEDLLGKSPAQAQRFIEAMQAAGIETAKFETTLRNKVKADAAAEASTAAAEGALGELAGTTKEATDATDDNTEADKRAAAAAKDRADRIKDVLSASEDLIASQLGVAGATDALRDSQADTAAKEKALADAIAAHGRGSQEAKDAAEDLEDARRSELRDIDALAKAQRDFAVQQAAQAGRPIEAADSYRIYRDEIIKLKDAIAPGSPLRTHLEELVNLLPEPEVKFKLVADVAEAEANLTRIAAARQAVGGPTSFGLGDLRGFGGGTNVTFAPGSIQVIGTDMPTQAATEQMVSTLGWTLARITQRSR